MLKKIQHNQNHFVGLTGFIFNVAIANDVMGTALYIFADSSQVFAQYSNAYELNSTDE